MVTKNLHAVSRAIEPSGLHQKHEADSDGRALPVPAPSFGQALRFWLKLGCISFGGTAAHIAIMHEELVERRQWIGNARFLHALSHCMVLPGPEAQQLAIYIGWKLHGKRGGIAAGTLFVLPAMFLLLALSVVYVKFGTLPWMVAIFDGLKPAVIAMVIVALLRVAKRALRSVVQYVVAAAAFGAMFFFDSSLPLVLSSAIILGVILGWLRPELLRAPHKMTAEAAGEDCSTGQGQEMPEDRSYLNSTIRMTAIVLVLWCLPLVALCLFGGDFHFWKRLVLFFTKTACVTVGGSYTVIPYVAQITVSKLHWVTRLQMTDGFALAETTPGPLIIVVSFVGFMAGYNHFHGSLWMATLALLATTFYTFLPCFLFVFAGAPLVERSQSKPIVEGVLGLITAVVVSAILNLSFFLGKVAFFPMGRVEFRWTDAISIVWAIVSFFLLQRLKLNVIYLVVLSIGFGLIRHALGA
jgi:chromate transporter